LIKPQQFFNVEKYNTIALQKTFFNLGNLPSKNGHKCYKYRTYLTMVEQIFQLRESTRTPTPKVGAPLGV
jgi:hypothetical protein